MLYLLILVSIYFSCLRSVVDGVSLENIIPWVAPFLFSGVLFGFSKFLRISHGEFIAAGTLFSILVIFLFIGRITGQPLLMKLNGILTSGASGFFNEKQAFFSQALPVVYFQGTLNLTFIAVLAFAQRRYISYAIMLLALVVAPSRFGVAVVLFSSLLYYLLRPTSLSRKTLNVFVTLCPMLLALCTYVLIENNTPGKTELVDPVRAGHLVSVLDEINYDPTILFFGSGPGSVFYTKGFQAYTDNIEISQLEVIRKYGLFFFVIIHVFLGVLIRELYRKGRRPLIFAIISHYVVSLSNPVLFSLPFMLFLAYCLVVSTSRQCHENCFVNRNL